MECPSVFPKMCRDHRTHCEQDFGSFMSVLSSVNFHVLGLTEEWCSANEEHVGKVADGAAVAGEQVCVSAVSDITEEAACAEHGEPVAAVLLPSDIALQNPAVHYVVECADDWELAVN